MRDFLINSYKQRIDHDTQCRIVQSLKNVNLSFQIKPLNETKKQKTKIKRQKRLPVTVMW